MSCSRGRRRLQDGRSEREQLAHIVRAAATITGDGDIVIIGSQSILGSYENTDLPAQATLSIEADVAFRNDPDGAKADEVDGSIGELSMFHETHGYYAQGVTLETARLPAGWQDRLIHLDRTDTKDGDAYCLESHDLVVAKLVAGREKDIGFAISLLAARIVDADTLRTRAGELHVPVERARVLDRITRCEMQAAEPPADRP